MSPRFGLLALALPILGAVMMLAAPPASAHAFLTTSNPADGAVLSAAPRVLRLDFSESVVIEATHIAITDSQGHRISPTSLRLVSGEDTEEPSHVVADLPPLPRSAYRISWRTLSSDDLHETSGVLVFGINAPVKATSFVEPPPRAEEAALRWLVFVSLATTLGSQLTSRLYRRTRAEGGEIAQRRCRRLAAAGAASGLLVALALLVDQVAVSGASYAQVLVSPYGERWGLRELGFALLLLAAWPMGRGGRAVAQHSRLRTAFIGLGTLGVCVGSALLGHAGSGPDFALTRTIADAAHLAAAATWSGTLLVVVVVLMRIKGTGLALRQVLRGFRIPAAACVSVVIVTGVYLASGVVGSVDAALLTTYGRTLLIKIGVVILVAALGLINTTRLHSRRSRATPRGTVYAEAALALTVLALAAVLTSGQPAREPEFVAVQGPVTVPVIDSAVADLQETLAVSPNRPGKNVVLMNVFDTRRPAPAPVRRVLVEIAGIDGRLRASAAAEQLTNGRWSVGADLDGSGVTVMRVTVERPGLADTVHDFSWMVGGSTQRVRAATVSTTPIAGTLEALAAGLAVLMVVGWGAALRRIVVRRRPIAGRASDGSPGTAAEEPAVDLVAAE